ncbi:enoyl-CoA hydratase-related protein [Burkholderiaceae bacterium FT117]|uniref:enoyl-CoA hydratase/isomerase family protein n=1 Tax=Zeimonas sediminis TaxID=2944268 RepID=UPI0023430DE3|nr:enoyl-CoA hydratase-related protein [Zeimonas sediminis]MCM5570474.1 enoyl-CoA hydratase-related protein [Zeimonas sediminis]
MSILYENVGAVARIIIDRPEAHNAFDDAMVTALCEAWRRFEASEQRVAVVTGGRSKHFTVGADLKAMPADVWQGVPGVAVPVSKPVIAAVQGYAVGVGMALVQAADLCIAADDAQMLYSEPRVGLAYGLISGLAARIPHKLAMEVMLRAKPVPAQRALSMGLVNAVVPSPELVDTAMQYATDIADAAPLVVRWLKESVDHHVLPDSPTVHALRTMERVREMIESRDFAEGKDAFVSRRAPKFTGS